MSERYLSNGTEGDIWLSQWCHRCANDHQTSHVSEEEANYDEGCPILAALYIVDDHSTIPELVYDSEPVPPSGLTCLMFSPCQKCDPGSGPERPFDPGPSHGQLFEPTKLAPGVLASPEVSEALRPQVSV